MYIEDEEDIFIIWVDEHLQVLEMDFINQLPPEDKPLDDDYQEYIEDNQDAFDCYCHQEYLNAVNYGE